MAAAIGAARKTPACGPALSLDGVTQAPRWCLFPVSQEDAAAVPDRDTLRLACTDLLEVNREFLAAPPASQGS